MSPLSGDSKTLPCATESVAEARTESVAAARTDSVAEARTDSVAAAHAESVAAARAAAGAVTDPEIPVLTLADLGILREVRFEDGRLQVTLTPTYTGCPATQVIEQDVRDALAAQGWPDAQVRTSLSPPWSTDWISEQGREKLRAYGIAPPGPVSREHAPIRLTGLARTARDTAPTGPACPRCTSQRVERLAEHGSTACKALYRCLACREPFDYFKPY